MQMRTRLDGNYMLYIAMVEGMADEDAYMILVANGHTIKQ